MTKIEIRLPLSDGVTVFFDREVDDLYLRIGKYEVRVLNDELFVGPFTSTGYHGHTDLATLLQVPLA